MKYIKWEYLRDLYNIESFKQILLSQLDDYLNTYFFEYIIIINEFEFLNELNNSLILK